MWSTSSPNSQCDSSELSSAQQVSHGASFSACADLGLPEPGITPAGAFRELCGFQSGCTAEPTAATRYQGGGLVSCPHVGIDVPDLAKVPPGRNLDRRCSWRRSLLCEESVGPYRQRECGARIPYSDPFVRDRAEYTQFVSEMLERRLVARRKRQAHTVGVFFVTRKSGEVDAGVAVNMNLEIDIGISIHMNISMIYI